MRSRFLSFVLVAALLPLSIAGLATREAGSGYEARIEKRIRVAAATVQARFDAEAARRRELLLRLSLLDGVASGVAAAAESGEAPAASVLVDVRAAIAEADPELVPEWVALATARGARMVDTSGAAEELAVAELPLAEAALSGQRAQGLLRFRDGLYRVSAVPVGVAEGALVVLDRVGDDASARLRELAQVAAVTFAAGGTALASTLPEPLRSAQAQVEQDKLVRLGAARANVPGLSFLDGVLPLGIVSADAMSMAVDLGGSVKAVITIATGSDLGGVSWVQLVALILSLLLLVAGAVWAVKVDGPYEAQARAVAAHLARMRHERGAKLGLAGFEGPFEELVRELDGLAGDLDRAPAAASPSTLDPVFSSPGGAGRLALPFDLPNSLPPPVNHAPPPTPSSPPASEGEEPGSDAYVPAPTLPPMQLPWVAPAAAEPVASTPVAAAVPPTPEGAGAEQDPFAALGSSPEVPLADRSREIPLTSEIRRELAAAMVEEPAPSEDPDLPHFREVYEAFRSLRVELGEAGEPPPFVRFCSSLRKNREGLRVKFGGRPVRFQAYVKDGKAAIKAAPVR